MRVKFNKPRNRKADLWVALAIFVFFGGFIAAAQGLVPGIPKAGKARPDFITSCCMHKHFSVVVLSGWNDERAEVQVAALDNSMPDFMQRHALLAIVRGTAGTRGLLAVGRGMRLLKRYGNHLRYSGGERSRTWQAHKIKDLRRTYGVGDDEFAVLVVDNWAGHVVQRFNRPVSKARVMEALDEAVRQRRDRKRRARERETTS